MSDGSKIEWTDATLNVVIGCDRVSPGCDRCYAIRTAHRMQANPNPKVAAAYAGAERDMEWTGQVNLVEDRLHLPLRWRRPRRIFVNAQSDLFHANVPDEFIAEVLAVAAISSRHTFQVLTKRHGRMRSLLSSEQFVAQVTRAAGRLWESPGWHHSTAGNWPGWPLPNLHLGVSVEDQATAALRIPALSATPAFVRWISAEPLLGPVTIDPDHLVCGVDTPYHWCSQRCGLLSWVVVGGESGPGARPMHPRWARDLRDQCVAADVPYFFKQWGEWAPVASNDARAADVWLSRDGGVTEVAEGCAGSVAAGAELMRRVGKRAAGNVLDGRVWEQSSRVVLR